MAPITLTTKRKQTKKKKNKTRIKRAEKTQHTLLTSNINNTQENTHKKQIVKCKT